MHAASLHLTHTHSGNRQLGSAKASGIGEEAEPVSILHPQVRTPTFMCTIVGSQQCYKSRTPLKEYRRLGLLGAHRY